MAGSEKGRGPQPERPAVKRGTGKAETAPEQAGLPGTAAERASTNPSERLHQAALSWLEQDRAFFQLTGKHYKAQRGSEAERGTVAGDVVNAVARGEAAALLTSQAKLGPDERRTNALRSQLDALGKEMTDLVGQPGVRESTRTRFARDRVLLQVGQELDALETLEDQTLKQQYQELKGQRGILTDADRDLERGNALVLDSINRRRTELATSPEKADATRLRELMRYRDQLRAGRFAETPTRKAYARRVQLHWEEGQAVLLYGPTGTGKSELVEHLARKLDGQPPVVTPGGEQIGMAELFGVKGLRGTKKGSTRTKFEPEGFSLAATQGRKWLIDEFDVVDQRARFQLKKLYNHRPGDSVTIPRVGKKLTIQEGYGLVATANLKSEKHRERLELDPAEARVFSSSSLKVEYMPKQEVYDLALAKLMDGRGGVRLAHVDAAQTLARLAEAAEWSQQAYLGTQSSLYAEGGGAKQTLATLEKAVLDPGAVLRMLDGWPAAEARGEAFGHYLNDKLATFVRQETFPQGDRRLLVRMLVSKGFLNGLSAKEIGVPSTTEKDLRDWGWKETDEAAPAVRLTSDEVARLDPFGLRAQRMRDLGAEFLGPPESTAATGARIEGALNPDLAEILGREQLKLREFFGRDVHIEDLPTEVTPERVREWDRKKFALHYLPAVDLQKDLNHPGWNVKPNSWFYEQIKSGALGPRSSAMHGGWVLVDTRGKPAYTSGTQQYPDDELATILANLRQGSSPVISPNWQDKKAGTRHNPDASRFGISWDELQKPEVKQAIATYLGVRPDLIRLPRAIEFNYLGNAFHPEWGTTNSWEWFDDPVSGGQTRLHGGSSHDGGLANVFHSTPSSRHHDLGFRPLVSFKK